MVSDYEQKIVYVRSFPQHFTARDLGHLFETSAGPIVRCNVVDRGRGERFAFVELVRLEDARTAYNVLHKHPFATGELLRVEWARYGPKEHRPNDDQPRDGYAAHDESRMATSSHSQHVVGSPADGRKRTVRPLPGSRLMGAIERRFEETQELIMRPHTPNGDVHMANGAFDEQFDDDANMLNVFGKRSSRLDDEHRVDARRFDGSASKRAREEDSGGW